MCLKKGCNANIQMCRCCLSCNCNESCYLCYHAYNFYESGFTTNRFEHSNADVRKKFVCFPCKRVWKSSFSKYIVHKVEDKCEGYENLMPMFKKVINNEPIPIYANDNSEKSCLECGKYIYSNGRDETIQKCAEVSKNNPYTKSQKKELKKCIRNDFASAYLINKSNCAKCGNPGNLVGRNFRHCKNDKEWKQLEQKYKDNPEGLYNDFYDYPREGNEETADKLKLKTGVGHVVNLIDNKHVFIYNKTKLYNC